MDVNSIENHDIYIVNYSEIYSELKNLFERCKKDADVCGRFPNGVYRIEMLNSTLKRAKFFMRFWSWHIQEVLIRGDIIPERILNIHLNELENKFMGRFIESIDPVWTKGTQITHSDLLKSWSHPFCSIGKDGGWDTSIGIIVD